MGEAAVRPADPAKSGYIFISWYTDNETFDYEWDFGTTPDVDLTLYAKWARIIVLELAAIELIQDPKLIYTHGELLDLSDLKINLLYDDGSFEAVSFNEFDSKGIITIPENGITLSRSLHNDTRIEIHYNGFSTGTGLLIINKAVISNIEFPKASAITFGQELYDSSLTGGDTSMGSFVWLNEKIQPEVNNPGFEVVFIPYNIDDYDFSGITGWNSETNTLTRDVLITVNPAPIAYSPVTVTGPMKGQMPAAAANGDGHFTTGNVIWSTENPQWTQGSEFLPLTVYTAAVTLTANANYTFNNASAAAINGNAAVITANTGNTITISYTFHATTDKGVSSMTIQNSPVLEYTHGNALNLNALSVQLVYDDNSSETVGYIDFEENNIGTNLSHGMILSRSDYHGHTLNVSIGNITQEAGALVVNQKQINLLSISHTKKYDDTPSIVIDLHSIELEGVLATDVGFVHVGVINAAYTSPNAGTKTIDITSITLEGIAGENYFIVTPVNLFAVTGGITKADGAAVNPSFNVVVTTITRTVKISNVQLSNDQQITEFVVSTSDTPPNDSSWIESVIGGHTFTGLDANTPYYIFVRAKESDNYLAGEARLVRHINFNSGVQFIIEYADIIDSAPNISSVTVSLSGGNVNVTMSGAPAGVTYSNIEWYINGALVSDLSGKSAFLINADFLIANNINSAGEHFIMLKLNVNDVPYSKIITITVTE